MNTTDSVFIKIQIEKSKHSGDLLLNINFDKDAPNFLINNDTICWSPTLEELDFVFETFEVISKNKNQDHQKKSGSRRSSFTKRRNFLSCRHHKRPEETC